VTRIVPLLAVLDTTANRHRVARASHRSSIPRSPIARRACGRGSPARGRPRVASCSWEFRVSRMVVLLCPGHTGSDRGHAQPLAPPEHGSWPDRWHVTRPTVAERAYQHPRF
jgi:hypothetical protein